MRGGALLHGRSVLPLGSVWFTQTTTVGVAGVRGVAGAVQALATNANTAGVGFWVAANQEGGMIQALRGAGFATVPSAVEQGKLNSARLQAQARTWGRELRAAGVNLDFAPVMDVVPAGSERRNQPIGVLAREYGNDPAAVGTHGVAFLRGMASAGVTTVAKHFPGLGRVVGNTDITAGVVDDDLGAATAISGIPPGTRAIDFLQAGGDLIVSKYVQPAEPMAAAILARSGSDPAFRSKIGAAAMRVLRAKQASRLLPCGG